MGVIIRAEKYLSAAVYREVRTLCIPVHVGQHIHKDFRPTDTPIIQRQSVNTQVAYRFICVRKDWIINAGVCCGICLHFCISL